MKITLEREGEFPVNWTHSHDHQCGNKGTSILRFRVRIWGTPQDLNDQGYLLDNTSIPHYFAEKYSKVRDFLSCERIAQTACEDLNKCCHIEGSKVQGISVSISGIPGSWITCEWVA